MKSFKESINSFGFVLSFGLVLAWNPVTASAEEKVIRFFVAHNYSPANEALVRKFADRVAERSKGKLKIEIDDESSEWSNSHGIALGKIYRGELEMSQLGVYSLARAYCDEMQVLDMPLVFRSHEHATKALDGKIGNKLKQCLANGSNGRLHGLFFTYSGGYRQIVSSRPIASLGELSGLKSKEKGSKSSNDLIDFLGASFVANPALEKDFVKMLENGSLDFEEAEINRLASYRRLHPGSLKKFNHVLETNHSMYLTMLVINGRFFSSLDGSLQKILEEESMALAKEERELSIQEATENRKLLASEGVKFTSLSDSDAKALQSLASKVHRKHEKLVGPELRAIKSLK
jgi:TRAP-type transport system periplasmic protein